jgi:hypothetical protein
MQALNSSASVALDAYTVAVLRRPGVVLATAALLFGVLPAVVLFVWPLALGDSPERVNK